MLKFNPREKQYSTLPMIKFYNLFNSLIFSFIIVAIAVPEPMSGQSGLGKDPDVLYDVVLDPNISTVKFNKEGLTNSSPVLELNGSGKITLKFDVLSTTIVKNYQYTIVHCNANWKPSDIFQSEYIDGMLQDYVYSFSPSINTYKPYTHYKLDFPSSTMKPRISGNYILKVYLNDPSQPVIQKRFYVYEYLADVGGTVHRPTYPQYRERMQEIDFEVNTPNLNIVSPYTDVTVNIQQNQRWDNLITNLKPQYVRDRTLVYNYEEGNLFEAGNEFRSFDTRDLRYKGIGVKQYTFDSLYHATLFTDEDRSFHSFNTYTDQNGGYTIASRQGNKDVSTEADYIIVHFTLKPTYNYDGKDVYIFGELSNWQADERFKMTYNESEKLFEAKVLLKQGYYDYQYMVIDERSNKYDASQYEGSHWETENNYLILIYYRQPAMLADQLVGMLRLNTTVK